MVSGLPERPLSYPEVEQLNHSDALGFVFPATPNSIQDDEQNRPKVYDLLITNGETVSALVYEEDGWQVVSQTDSESSKEAVVEDVIEYREYEVEDEEKVFQFVTELYEAMDELSEDK